MEKINNEEEEIICAEMVSIINALFTGILKGLAIVALVRLLF